MLVLRKACLESGSALSQFVWELCENFINVYHDWGETLAPAHDAVPIMYLLRPDLFESRNVRVEVETRGEITRGMSIADWKGQWGKGRNCTVLRRRLGKTWICVKLLVAAVHRAKQIHSHTL
ncbi:rihA [Symbiodinium microadriaticum]|nr:rihA [Symbiodinium microadriaticum]